MGAELVSVGFYFTSGCFAFPSIVLHIHFIRALTVGQLGLGMDFVFKYTWAFKLRFSFFYKSCILPLSSTSTTQLNFLWPLFKVDICNIH